MKRWIHAKEDFVVDYDLQEHLDRPGAWERAEKRRIERELADEADAYDEEYAQPIESNSQVGTHRGVQYGMEDDGTDNRYYFVDKGNTVHYADTEEEMYAIIDAFLDGLNRVDL